jgi:hypothetical protein
MATRAERFRAQQERSHPHKPNPPRRPSTLAFKQERLEREVSGTVFGPDRMGSGLRNLGNGRQAAYALEDTSVMVTPSRKSTRRAAKTGIKSATTLTSRQMLRNDSPAVRHDRRT